MSRNTGLERETTVSQSLIAFDTDHIKGYVFGTNKLKEIRGASSILDRLNRRQTEKEASKFGAEKIYAHGGSALFVVEESQAEQLGRAVQRLYHDETKGGSSITYAIQPIPTYEHYSLQELMNVEMPQELNLLSYRLQTAKDGSLIGKRANNAPEYIALATHPLLCTCDSCGMTYAEYLMADNDNPEGRYCRICKAKRDEDKMVRDRLRKAKEEPLPKDTLWGRILTELKAVGYNLPDHPRRPEDFDTFRRLTRGKEYLGLIYADANGMGKALTLQTTLGKRKSFAERVDNAVYHAMAKAIQRYLSPRNSLLPFDILLVGGDDIVLVTPADKALQVASALVDEFRTSMNNTQTLSVGVVLAPVKYPFGLQRELVDDVIKDAKKSGAVSNANNKTELSRINFIVVTGNTSLSYQHIYEEMYRVQQKAGVDFEFYATMRPYTLQDFHWLLGQLSVGNEKHLGRTKLHQLREAILKKNNTTTILESLALLRNCNPEERKLIKLLADKFDERKAPEQQRERLGVIFPWSLNGSASNKQHLIYRTPLLDFIELYDFIFS